MCEWSVNGCLKCNVEGCSRRGRSEGFANEINFFSHFLLIFLLKKLLDNVACFNAFFFLVIKLLSERYSGQNIYWNLRSQMLLPHESALAEESRIFFFPLACEEASTQDICIISFRVLQHF